MEQSIFSFSIDKDLTKQFDSLCEDFGMTPTTAFNIFVKAVIRERKIPFEIVASQENITRDGTMKVFEALREEAKNNGLQNMTLEDINGEIALSRSEREESL